MIKSTLVLSLVSTLMAGSAALAANADFNQVDANKDGKITFDEGVKFNPNWTAQSFMALDLNGDNALNTMEYANAQAAATANPDATTVAASTVPKSDANPTSVTNIVPKNGPASYLDAAGPNDILASKLIGMRVYAVDTDVDVTKNYPADSRKNWSDVGEINDVVLDWDGSIKAVVLGVGGFLGIGEKDVAVEMSSLRKVRETADSNDWFLVVNSSKQALTSAPKYVRSAKS